MIKHNPDSHLLDLSLTLLALVPQNITLPCCVCNVISPLRILEGLFVVPESTRLATCEYQISIPPLSPPEEFPDRLVG